MQPIRLWEASRATVRVERLPTVYCSATLTEHQNVIGYCIHSLIRSSTAMRCLQIHGVPARPQAKHLFNDFV